MAKNNYICNTKQELQRNSFLKTGTKNVSSTSTHWTTKNTNVWNIKLLLPLIQYKKRKSTMAQKRKKNAIL